MLAGRYEDALVSLLQCLSLDSTIAKAKALLAKVLQKMLSPLPTPENLKCAEIQTRFVLGGRVLSTPISIFSNRLNDVASAISMGFKKFEGRMGVGSSSVGYGSSIQISSSEVVTSKMDKTPDEGASKDCFRLAGELQKKRKHSGRSSSDGSTSHENKFLDTEVKHEPRVIPKDLLNLSDYECSLCFRLLLEPATTPCGHTFCTGCLNRCLDHKPQCPLCKESLTEFLATEKRSINKLITNILNQYFEKEFDERAETHAKEMEELRGAVGDQNESIVPVFICTIAYPTIPCPLHIFEPRYKLMIRQCMESGSKQFGMCIPSEHHEFSDIGCMLKILEVQTLPNGRSAIRTVGAKRFKVLNRSMRDGYNIAKVNFIQDETIQDEQIDQIKTLHRSVHAEAKDWFKLQLPRVRLKITQYYGWIPALPDSLMETPEGPVWTWWLLAILPIERRAQLECMALTTIKDRLMFLQRCLRAIQNT